MKILLENWREYLAEEEDKKIIALVPGKFKPPHAGHLEMVKHYANIADEVMVLISPKALDLGSGRVINDTHSSKIWDVYLRDAGLSNVTVITSPSNSPVRAAFEYVENKKDNPLYAQSGDQIIMGASTKGGDQKRFAGDLQKYAKQGVKILNPMQYAFEPFPPALSATDFRNALSRKEDITSWLPTTSQGEESVEEITNILDANSGEEAYEEALS